MDTGFCYEIYSTTQSFVTFVFFSNRNVLYDEKDRVINLNWTEPSSGSKCVDTYEVTAENFVHNQTKLSKVEKEFFQVYAWLEYIVGVAPKTFNNMTGGSVTKLITIPPRGMTIYAFSSIKLP